MRPGHGLSPAGGRHLRRRFPQLFQNSVQPALDDIIVRVVLQGFFQQVARFGQPVLLMEDEGQIQAVFIVIGCQPDGFPIVEHRLFRMIRGRVGKGELGVGLGGIGVARHQVRQTIDG